MNHWINSIKWAVIFCIMILVYVLMMMMGFYDKFDNKTNFWLVALGAFLFLVSAAVLSEMYGEEE
ncbi:MAG: hypothetical protein AAFV95_19520 [Bacteroidota bacterium]